VLGRGLKGSDSMALAENLLLVIFWPKLIFILIHGLKAMAIKT
jgi:hypothetical protein